MIKSSVASKDLMIRGFSGSKLKSRSLLPLFALIFVLLVGAALGRLTPATSGYLTGAIVMVIISVLRLYELAVAFILAVNLYVDWYLGVWFVSQILVLGLLLTLFVARSPQHPWEKPRTLWLWILFLLLPILPATYGLSLGDGFYYYLNIIFAACSFFWLGTVVARNAVSLRRLLLFLSIFAALIALHAIVQTTTGTFLFETSRFDAYFAQVFYYDLANSNVQRAGTFLINPDSSGGFFAITFFLPLCLFIESSSLVAKLGYLVGMFLMLVALLFTYSTGGWVAVAAGIVAFVVFVGYKEYRVIIPLLILSAVIGLVLFFPTQMSLQIQHATAPRELVLREGAWQTGIEVIRAFPLSGIGLGRYVYVVRAEPYRQLLQYRPLAHPHNAYLEIGALAGLPVLLIFIVLLGVVYWQTIRNWTASAASTRTLLAGGIAATVALCVNSLVANSWTLVPLAAIGWLILGAISSPLLLKNHLSAVQKELQP